MPPRRGERDDRHPSSGRCRPELVRDLEMAQLRSVPSQGGHRPPPPDRNQEALAASPSHHSNTHPEPSRFPSGRPPADLDRPPARPPRRALTATPKNPQNTPRYGGNGAPPRGTVDIERSFRADPLENRRRGQPWIALDRWAGRGRLPRSTVRGPRDHHPVQPERGRPAASE